MTSKFNVLEAKELLKVYSKLLPQKILVLGVNSGDIITSFLRESPIGAKIIIIEPDRSKLKDWSNLSNGLSVTTKVFNSDILDYKNTEYIKDAAEDTDFILIDCTVGYEDVAKVFERYSSMIKKGGIIAISNILEESNDGSATISMFWEEVKREFPHEQISFSKVGKGIGVLYING